MSPTSIGYVLTRPIMRALSTVRLKLPLSAGRVAISRSVRPKGISFIKQTFHTLFRPTHLSPTRAYPTPRSLPRSNLRPHSLTSLSPRLRSSLPRGPSLVSSIGLSPARQFSSSGAQAMRELSANVPIGFRALAERMRDEQDRLGYLKAGRRGRVMKGVLGREKRLARGSRWAGMKQERREAFVEEMDKYFPLPTMAAAAATTLKDDTPVNATTYLLLPLSPSYLTLLAPTPASPSPNLFPVDPPKRAGILDPLAELTEYHSTHIQPLLDTLSARGLLGSSDPWERAGAKVTIEVIYDGIDLGGDRKPESLRLSFPNRSVAFVESLIASSSSGKGKGWYHTYSVPHPAPVSQEEAEGEGSEMGLSDISMHDLNSLSPSTLSPSSPASDGFASPTLPPMGDETIWRMPTLSPSGATFEGMWGEEDVTGEWDRVESRRGSVEFGDEDGSEMEVEMGMGMEDWGWEGGEGFSDSEVSV